MRLWIDTDAGDNPDGTIALWCAARAADIDLVGQASDGTEAVAVAGESLPDIVLMDIRMPKSSGIEACRAIKEVAPSAKIVILTISDEEEDLFELLHSGWYQRLDPAPFVVRQIARVAQFAAIVASPILCRPHIASLSSTGRPIWEWIQ